MARGTWSDVFAWPIVGIHAILTPDGKVLTYGTDKSGQQGATLYLAACPGRGMQGTARLACGSTIWVMDQRPQRRDSVGR